jgi:hypothetical protein
VQKVHRVKIVKDHRGPVEETMPAWCPGIRPSGLNCKFQLCDWLSEGWLCRKGGSDEGAWFKMFMEQEEGRQTKRGLPEGSPLQSS